MLKREVEGYRENVARLERGEPVLPKDDVAIAIADSLIRDLIGAQLPFEADVDRFHIALETVEVRFRGSPVVELTGALNLKDRPNLQAAARVIGALEDIAVDPATATLKAHISVDHLAIEKVAGMEQMLSGSTLDEVGRMIRLQIKDKLPEIQIPVKVQQSIELPAVTQGPVRLDGARMPLQVAVSQVLAGQGILWIARALPARRPREDRRRAGGRRQRGLGRGRGRLRRRRCGQGRPSRSQARRQEAGEGPMTKPVLAVLGALAAAGARRPGLQRAQGPRDPRRSCGPRSRRSRRSATSCGRSSTS